MIMVFCWKCERVAKTKEIGIQLDRSVVERVRKDHGMRRKKARYGAFVREENKPIREKFFSNLLKSRTGMWDWVFVDESVVMLERGKNYVYVCSRDKYGHIFPTVKFPTKVSITEKERGER